ncbi:Uncharacterized protein GBIM_06153 [Gryllus bimaculatus]|nr:Uncharacterized protein GBIM_06153 [Gryllus bimaculatus]
MSSSWKSYFKGEEHAAVYNKIRPSPPQALIENIVEYLLEKLKSPLNEALDVGCGSGQSTKVLEPYFKKITGIDTSEEQIIEAQSKNTYPKITYRIGSAEKIEYPDASVQLITASQACHWFDLPKFYEEVERILVPGGILAMYGYLLPTPMWNEKTEELSGIVYKYYNIALGKYIPPESRMVYLENYRGDDFMKIPFAKEPIIRDESVSSETPGTVADIVGFMKSGSAFQNFLNIEGSAKASALLQEFEKELMDTLGISAPPEETPIIIQYKYFVIMARKPLP